MQLETLINQLGLTEHMEALSDWRDALLVEKAAELQTLHLTHADAITALGAASSEDKAEAVAAKEVEIASLTSTIATLSPLKSLYEQMVPKVKAALLSGDPEQFIAIGREFLTPEKDKQRQLLLAQLAALDEESGE